ncbi:MAG TPA: hypothetical protein PKW23_05520 [Dictyoglomaceae bacterium]|nr:hypothetical protein [Dictyoglomaceae bacterium]HOL39578.1 hypothetical protein [Dictyoglomaceae bacterium]HPP16470.1 hypothetical protein [Dictyoglomaceae bacterium]
MKKFSKSNLDWEERLVVFYYTALESYVDKLELSEELKNELDEQIEEDDYLILAQFLALATKKFLQQEGGLKQEADWDLLFPHTYYIH